MAKYPIIYKDKKAFLKMPFEISRGNWISVELYKDGTIKEVGFALHKTKESCLIVCRAFNNRVGYTDKKTDKLIKKYFNVEKAKAREKNKK